MHVALTLHFNLTNKARLSRTGPTYSNSNAKGRVTPYALENAHRQLSSSYSYWCWRQASDVFIVVRRRYEPTESLITRFWMARVVTNINGRLRCTCKFFERHGYPCRHIYTVTGLVQVSDFDVRWWLNYGRFYGEPGKLSCYLMRTWAHILLFCVKAKNRSPVL